MPKHPDTRRADDCQLETGLRGKQRFAESAISLSGELGVIRFDPPRNSRFKGFQPAEQFSNGSPNSEQRVTTATTRTTGCSLNVVRLEYSTARNGGKVLGRLKSPHNNGLASYLPAWTKPTSCADSISAESKDSELRRRPRYAQRTTDGVAADSPGKASSYLCAMKGEASRVQSYALGSRITKGDPLVWKHRDKLSLSPGSRSSTNDKEEETVPQLPEIRSLEESQ